MTTNNEINARRIIKQWNENYSHHGENFLIKQFRYIDLDDETIATILVIIDNTCHHCWDKGNNCKCWNDE